MKTFNVIFIGDEFYRLSGSSMSSVYTEDGERTDFGHIQAELRAGSNVNIRQATEAEFEHYRNHLYRLLNVAAVDRDKELYQAHLRTMLNDKESTS